MTTMSGSNEFIGQLLEASIAQTHYTMNALHADALDEAIDYANHFMYLFDAVEQVNDSLRVDRVLGAFSAHRVGIEGHIKHLESMRDKVTGA